MKKTIRRLVRCFKLRQLKNKLYALDCDMMLGLIDFREYEQDWETITKMIDEL